MGGGALAVSGLVGGAAATATGPGRRLLHSAGLLDGDDHDAPDAIARVAYDSFESRAMGRTVRFGLSTVPSPSGVIVCLHGRGADERFAFDSIGVHRFVR